MGFKASRPAALHFTNVFIEAITPYRYNNTTSMNIECNICSKCTYKEHIYQYDAIGKMKVTDASRDTLRMAARIPLLAAKLHLIKPRHGE